MQKIGLLGGFLTEPIRQSVSIKCRRLKTTQDPFDNVSALPAVCNSIYRPLRSCGQGNVFTRVCHSVHRGGLARRTPPGPDTTTPPGPDPPPPGMETTPPPGSRLRHTVYERPVRILLECILICDLVKSYPRKTRRQILSVKQQNKNNKACPHRTNK